MKLSTLYQKGLTITEMVIAISMSAVLLLALLSSIDSDKEKSRQLFEKMNDTKNGILRQLRDFPAGSKGLGGLASLDGLNPPDVTTTGSLTAADNSPGRWNGPYIESSKLILDSTTSTYAINLNHIVSGVGGNDVILSKDSILMADPITPTKLSKVVYLKILNLPSGIKNNLLDECGQKCDLSQYGVADGVGMTVFVSPLTEDNLNHSVTIELVTPASDSGP